MLRRILTGVVLTIASSLAIPVALDSVSTPAGGSSPVTLSDLANPSITGTTSAGSANGCDFTEEFDSSYPGSPNVGSVALHVLGCLNNNPDSSGYVVSGSFTVTTNVGTLSGSASGSASWYGASHTALVFQLTLPVQSGTGSFAMAPRGNLQFAASVGTGNPGNTFSGGVFAISAFVARPSNGATVSGTTILDASATQGASVSFWLFGGVYGYSAAFLCDATLTQYGWVCSWDTTTVPNGSYVLLGRAANSAVYAFSPNVNITVNNPSTLTATIARPSNGATVAGTTIFDASATNATSVEFRLFGGIYGYSAPVLCTATLTQYGWVCSWNSATSPNGSYVLVAEASNSTSTSFSPNVNITIKN